MLGHPLLVAAEEAGEVPGSRWLLTLEESQVVQLVVRQQACPVSSEDQVKYLGARMGLE
jgi:hypothetical protein